MNILRIFLLVTALANLLTVYAQNTPLKILAFHNPDENSSHIEFAQEAISFFSGFNGNGELLFEHTSDPGRINEKELKDISLIIMLNHIPLDNNQQKVFQHFMENGGKWVGFYRTARYANEEWPWFREFIGGVSCEESIRPALPAKLYTEDPLHPVCRGISGNFIAPANEWHVFSPGLRDNPYVSVLLSMAAESFPGKDIPVAWINKKYNMVYIGMGHDGDSFSNPTQNLLINNALKWLITPQNPLKEKVVAAYVTSWKNVMPDPTHITHINYAFGHVNDSCNGIRVDNPERLLEIVALKDQKPSLKVLLSIGGWGSGRFSEMTANDTNRESFSRDCRRIVDEFGLDGIDIDWEYPTNPGPGISFAPEDTRNFTLLMRDIRRNLAPGQLLTLASAASGKFIDFKSIVNYVDFVNIMTYDIAYPPFHHSGLYPSSLTGDLSCYEAVLAHVSAGFPLDRLVLGIPFYGKPSPDFPQGMNSYGKLIQLENYEKCWDDIAKAPYLKDSTGKIVCNYDDPRSIGYKCRFIHEYGMKGAMYWEYEGDDDKGSLRQAVFNGIFVP
ncbi:MAG TPA: glycosyl hydrolase family 18 protein [Bacteroidales bacterium]|nr:glycosyl hydrolase family 18 protein [Bacteroidales bacterium]HRW94434.1 glycosyl hydrolase family 18 protein [Bacteroidales bacterium]